MKYLAITFSFLFFISCSVEEPTKQYTTAIRNTGNQTLHVLILGDTIGRNYPVYDTLVNTTLSTGESFKRTYRNVAFSGFFAVINYSKFTFIGTNKGYICDDVNNNDSLCFTNKKNLSKEYNRDNFTLENGIYYYDITQEDYENAHELP